MSKNLSSGESYSDADYRLHLREPDYRGRRLRVRKAQRERICDKLKDLYGRERAEASYPELERIMRVYYAHKTEAMIEADRNFSPEQRFSQKDVVLITYGDLLKKQDRGPLEALSETLEENRRLGINTVHLLPFFSFSSDRGFSIIDYKTVDSRLGTWAEIEKIGLKYWLMFDGVFNHVSAKSMWFQEFLNDNPAYADFFIRFSTQKALPKDYRRLILRPRTSSLLTGFNGLSGRHYVWTTFSPDQVDLNYRNPQVLLRIIEVLLYYVRRGADIIRLDAVTYMWWELGTSCALLKESHSLVQLFRAVLDVVAPRVALITETNVPHRENISYFGDGANEAQMVYNFALPPLVLQAFQTGDCSHLRRWARGLDFISESATYFNFLDSHDGIGLLPVQGILSESEIAEMIRVVEGHGALVSYRRGEGGKKAPYEINTTWFSALNREGAGETVDLQVDRFIASRSIALSLQGVPGIYLPSLVGSRNDTESLMQGEGPRSINRGTLDLAVLEEKVRDPATAASRIFQRFGKLIRIRTRTAAFHPNASQRILECDPGVFAVVRCSKDGKQQVFSLTNITASTRTLRLDRDQLQAGRSAGVWKDLVSGETFRLEQEPSLLIPMEPYQVRWLLRSSSA